MLTIGTARESVEIALLAGPNPLVRTPGKLVSMFYSFVTGRNKRRPDEQKRETPRRGSV